MGVIDWNALKMVRSGTISTTAWNTLIDSVQTLELNSVVGGQAKEMYGVGTDLVIAPAAGSTPGTYPWRIVNTSTGSTGQVQLMGTDGPGSQFNGFTCKVNGSPSDTMVSGAYPMLSVTGNGTIYAFATPVTSGTATPLASVDLYYEGTAPTPDTANPETYVWVPIADIANYAVDGSGKVKFDVNNNYGSGYGPSTLIYCSGKLKAY